MMLGFYYLHQMALVGLGVGMMVLSLAIIVVFAFRYKRVQKTWLKNRGKEFFGLTEKFLAEERLDEKEVEVTMGPYGAWFTVSIIKVIGE